MVPHDSGQVYKDQLNLPFKLNNEYELYIIGVGVGGAEQNERRNIA